MSTTTVTHHPAPMAAAAAAVVALALGGVAFAIANRDSGGSIAPSDHGNHAVAPPQHGGHIDSTTTGGTVMTAP